MAHYCIFKGHCGACPGYHEIVVRGARWCILTPNADLLDLLAHLQTDAQRSTDSIDINFSTQLHHQRPKIHGWGIQVDIPRVSGRRGVRCVVVFRSRSRGPSFSHYWAKVGSWPGSQLFIVWARRLGAHENLLRL